ncbi:MAG: hypothetical protein MR598_01245 [Erysipelotrichaceae bacterium]|nr:hypothetical protein [Erysipelotrichaceae bacterium]
MYEKSYCNHMKVVDGRVENKYYFSNALSVYPINYQLIEIRNQEDSVIYNKKTFQIILRNIKEIHKEYPQFKNVVPGEYYFVKKVIKEQDNVAELNFFIDRVGMIVSPVFDLARSFTYSVSFKEGSDQNVALEKIYLEVINNLIKENKEAEIREQRKKVIYQLELKK